VIRMKIVIDISEEEYMAVKQYPGCFNFAHAILEGTPLPKGHGRLIDVSDIEWAKHREERNYIDYEVIDWDDIVNAPTIIEAESDEPIIDEQTERDCEA